MDKINLTIITVHKGPINQLKKTLKSIDSQNFNCVQNIVVAKNLNNYQINFLKKKNRLFILNKDKSIYDGMNLGLQNISFAKSYILFLNSGDYILKKNSFYILKKFLILNIPIIASQILESENKRFIIKKKIFYKKSIPHGSFLCPPLYRLMPKFNIKRAIDADGFWMREVLRQKKNCFKKILYNFTVHSLGGVSTNPTFFSLQNYLKVDFKQFCKELTKYILKIIFRKKYYNVVYYFRYNILHNV